MDERVDQYSRHVFKSKTVTKITLVSFEHNIYNDSGHMLRSGHDQS